MNFKVEDAADGRVTVIYIPERLTSETSDELKQILKELVEAGKYNIVMDLTKTKYMDSSGLGAIVSKIASARSKRGDIRLANPRKYVLDLLALTHIDQIIKVFSNLNEAVDSFKDNE